ncbi:hypothetical protein KR009_002903 [Drosophila setifemur]|nr:hypothetical protein KR009_002903 [Drosophila setifemur]
MLTNDAADTTPNHRHFAEPPNTERRTPRTTAARGWEKALEKRWKSDGGKRAAIDSDSYDDDDKRFTFSKSNGGISHRKAKDTQPRP